MDNLTYIQSLGIKDRETREKCLAAMETYGDNKWWEPDADKRALAYYQMNEPLLLVHPFSKFHEALELLLGRPVWTHELGISADKIRAEAQRAWMYNVGVTSDEERAERVQESMQDLQDWAKKNGKQVIEARLPEEATPAKKRYHIECTHEHDEQIPDYYPLTKEEIAELLSTAYQAHILKDSFTTSSIQVRLDQGIRGIMCPREIDGPVAKRESQLDSLFVKNVHRGADPELVQQFYQLMQ